jgi:hypothetical protein
VVRNCQDLLQGTDEFQAKEAHFASRLLAQDLSHDGWRPTGNKAGSGSPRGGDRQMNCLIWPQDVNRGNAGARGANIKRLGEFDELNSRYIGSPQEDWYLQANARRASG